MFGLEQPDQKSLLLFVAWFLLSTLGKAIASLSSTDIAKPCSEGGTNFFLLLFKNKRENASNFTFPLTGVFQKIFSILWFSKVSSGEKGCEFINGLNYFNTTSLPKEDGHTFFLPCSCSRIGLHKKLIFSWVSEQNPQGTGAQRTGKPHVAEGDKTIRFTNNLGLKKLYWL